MTLLEQLDIDHRQEFPGVKEHGLYKLVLEHFDEITIALNMRYSWEQITFSASKVWKDELPHIGYRSRSWNLIQNYYLRIKKEKKRLKNES